MGKLYVSARVINNPYRRLGFTAVEVLIALVIVTLVVTIAVVIYLMANTAWQEASAQLALQRNAALSMEKMTRGIEVISTTGARCGIREAEAISAPLDGSSGTRIDFTGLDSTERSFYLNEAQLMYDPDTSASGDEYSLTGNVINLQFTRNGSIVDVTLQLQRQVRERTMDVNLSTTIKGRNL